MQCGLKVLRIDTDRLIDIGAYSHKGMLYLVTVSLIHTKGGSSLIDSDSYSHKGTLS